MDDKRYDGLTITDELTTGVLFAGVRHKRFTLRVPMAGDLIGAQEAYPVGPMQLITLDVYRRQLVKLGDIPPESLTTALLREALTESDLAELAKADEELEKKLKAPSVKSSTGEGSSTS